MARHRLRGTDASLSGNSEDEVIWQARRSAELHYRHELDIDIDAVYADLQQWVPVKAPPPRSRLHQAWASFWQACRQLPWNWRALKLPYPLMLSIVTVTTLVVILRALTVPVPEIQGAVQEASAPASSHTYANPAQVADQTIWRHSGHHTHHTGNGNRQQPSATNSSGDPSSASSPLVDVKVGSEKGSLVSLVVTLTGNGTADLSLAVDPAAATCNLSRLTSDVSSLPHLLATLTAPIQVRVNAGPRHPLRVELSPTGIPAQPLACSVRSPDPQPDPQSGRPTATSSPASLSGTVNAILGSVTSLLPH